MALCAALVSDVLANDTDAARGVLERTLGKEAAQSIELKLEAGDGEGFRYRAADGKLAVTGTRRF